MRRLLLKNGLVIDPFSGTETKNDLLIEGGRIARVGSALKAPAGCESFDAGGLWVFPGFVDAHVHAREPGSAAETLLTAARAAAAGGVTSLLLMPNTDPPMATAALLRKYSKRAALLPVNVYLSAAITAGRAGKKLAAFAALKKAGAKAFTDDGTCPEDPGLFAAAVRAAAAAGLPLLDHPEFFSITGAGVVNAGSPVSRRLPAIAPEAEYFAVLRDIAAAAASGPVHLQHLSLAASVDALRAAKACGLPVTGETCPHYFTLTDRDINPANADFKMKPPLRSPADREAVLAAVADGTIDIIATDHAPHERRLKEKGFLAAPFGITGLETLAPLCVTELALKRGLSKLLLARLLSANPARLLGLPRKGGLAPGFDADITVLDPRRSRRVPQKFFSLSDNSPFKGRSLKGWPVAVIARGLFVFRYGRPQFC